MGVFHYTPCGQVNPANHALDPISLVSKGNLDRFALRHLLRLSIALFKASILGVRNFPFSRPITFMTASALRQNNKGVYLFDISQMPFKSLPLFI